MSKFKNIKFVKSLKMNPSLKRSVLVMISFMFIGIGFIILTKAASLTVDFQAEDGICSGNASKILDGSASGGAAIKFGQACQKDIIVSTTGNDSKDGSSVANAVKTITKAVSLANSPSRIRLMTGTYVETVWIQKNDLTIEPYGNGDVNIIGSIPELINGVSWGTTDHAGVYHYFLPGNNFGGRDEFNSSGNPIYGSDGKQQWSYPNLTTLQDRRTLDHIPGAYVSNDLLSRSDVYVATDTGQPPTTPLYIGKQMATFDIINVNNISINGISGSKLKISYGSTNIKVRNSTNINISNVDINGGMPGIAAFDSSNVSIKNNYVHGTFDPNWTYTDVKDINETHTMEHEGILVRADNKNVSNIVVDSNDVSAYFDGIQFPVLDGLSQVYTIDDSVISNNTIYNLTADGIEADGPYRNMVIKGNIVYDTFTPLSAAVSTVGPSYVYENLFIADHVDRLDPANPDSYGKSTIGPSYSIKLNQYNNEATENMHFYYNTFYFAGNDRGERLTVDSNASVQTKNVTFTNNIFYSYQKGILWGTGRAQDGLDWDGNVFYSADSTFADNYYGWNSLLGDGNSYSSLSSIISGGKMPSQWQGNVEGNPGFNCVADTNASCFRPTASITKPTSLQPVPAGFPERDRLNNRTTIGAFDN